MTEQADSIFFFSLNKPALRFTDVTSAHLIAALLLPSEARRDEAFAVYSSLH